MTIAPFGSWPTPITSELVVAAAVSLAEVRVDGAEVYWSEARPADGGRTQLVRRAADGAVTDLLPDGSNARTGVHEYGGGAWWVLDGVVWFTEWADQRLYRLADGAVQALTPAPAVERGDRYADGDVHGDVIVCVRERHGDGEPRNEIVRLAAHAPTDEPEVLVTGPDFVAAPRLDPDGTTLAWLQWNHPSMPWDAVELVVRDLATGEETVVAGGPWESVSEPSWMPDGSLWFVSDRTDWWNLYRWLPGSDIEPIVRIDAEVGVPEWRLAGSRYAVLADGSVVFARRRAGSDALAVRGTGGLIADLDLPFCEVGAVRSAGGSAVVVAGTPTAEPGVYRVTPPGPDSDAAVVTLCAPRDLGLDPAGVAVAEHLTFPSVDAAGEPRTAHALYFAPASATHTGPEGDAPPLVVVIHGGPTAAASSSFSPATQYWTSRGFAVVSVDHGGSTGYGRAYREELLGQWGVIEVADCLAVARRLADTGRADPARLLIRGGSAGGFTVLSALARAESPFAAGADHFGVADLEALARDTHKFESRYLDRLVGPYPQDRDTYVERSPIHQLTQFSAPLIVLQGAEDAIVPPAQSEMIVDALRAKGVPVAYLLFDGEQHGFRRAENIRRALDAELSFYAQVLGFDLPADEGIEPVEIENL
ncbi:S9 family peptidase [Pseudonocardia abyssalis]|uniref:S9 family peptidase n=1 Tax=Pseudonocardia abyssalis TaxID=2792008 RepID=A0ABS6USW9_9PSEU|nr:prolyl oligopeptidase family serine peptidase [Pseudonocardia abyssalis]MBW0114351.1 S9 family peptidase [Pseudonocardia abyssalis]MBW0135367.1 S9 family peptidase [Pseudonocardia abyssalis]